MDARQLFNKWVILGALIVAGLLILITVIVIGWTNLASIPRRWVCSRRPDRDLRPDRHPQRHTDSDH